MLCEKIKWDNKLSVEVQRKPRREKHAVMLSERVLERSCHVYDTRRDCSKQDDARILNVWFYVSGASLMLKLASISRPLFAERSLLHAFTPVLRFKKSPCCGTNSNIDILRDIISNFEMLVVWSALFWVRHMRSFRSMYWQQINGLL